MREVQEVHHKLPLSKGGTHSKSNLISLCKSCHAKIMRAMEVDGEKKLDKNNFCEKIFWKGGLKISEKKMNT